jgi:hypothetical protein
LLFFEVLEVEPSVSAERYSRICWAPKTWITPVARDAQFSNDGIFRHIPRAAYIPGKQNLLASTTI